MAMLIRRGARVDAVDDNGRTPLWTGVVANNLTAVEELLDAGANPWAKDHSGARRGVCVGGG